MRRRTRSHHHLRCHLLASSSLQVYSYLRVYSKEEEDSSEVLLLSWEQEAT